MVMPKVDLWARVAVGDEDACWPWAGPFDRSGYGRFGKRSLMVHRVVYELLCGPIPDGYEIDHLCHTRDQACLGGTTCPHRRCVNPAHLEPVTHTENAYRGKSFTATNAAKTECINGHPFTPENTYVRSKGHRGCRKCTNQQQRRYQQRQRESA